MIVLSMVSITMSKSVLVTGKGGQLGRSIQKMAFLYSGFDFTFVGREDVDFSDTNSIEKHFANNQYDVVINCAAYTAVDKAESEPELAEQINHLAVKKIAEIAKQQDAALIHISTDYVFNGQNHKPYIELDVTDPQSVYGLTKLKGEQAIQAINPKGCIVRTSWVYSEYGNNFVKTMLRLGKEKDKLRVIFDQIGTPTYATDLAKAILHVIASEAWQPKDDIALIYHYSNEGVCSWYDLAKAIFELSGISSQVRPIETKDYPTPAKRPYYSVMNKSKIKKDFNLEIPYWRDSLNKCLAELTK